MGDHEPRERGLSHKGERENQRNHLHVMVQQKVVIPNCHGEKLVGVLHETGSKKLVVVCHGFRSSKDRIPMVNLAVVPGKIGISTFRFDFAGNGESEGSFQYGNYHREVEDLRAVVQHFRGKKHTIIAILGHSKGGNVVLLYASKYHDVYTVVNISGRFDLEKGMEDRLGKDFLQRIKQQGFIEIKNRRGKLKYRVTEENLLDRFTIDTLTQCKLIPPDCRVLTVHGSMDQVVPVTDAIKFSKVIPNHVLRIVDEADHEYTLHQDELASVVMDFIRVGLQQELPSHAGADSSTSSRL
ncbi:hypothetical protein Nepgr_014211 [Nepenthes gracilis]|uniref:Serine aminopeptidase S33 domain-containing protein n=1 Tax=Nepenthes gracilis TaxID=150966 RepID=A0AAD3SK97_NEPGR|nr:hypothetical protein Nepgr_014211 [Nepenthes gracilis]